MNTLTIDVHGKKLFDAWKALAGMPGAVKKVVTEALNRTGAGLKTDAVKETKQRYHLLPSEIRKHMVYTKITGASQSVSLITTGQRKQLADYRVQGRGADIKVAVRTGGMKTLKTGFLTDRKGRKVVLWRPRGEGTPAVRAYSPSVSQAVENRETQAVMKKQAIERFEKRLDQNIDRLTRRTFK